jgi:hypothetical protein
VSEAPHREFDLKIERVLENWTVAHAVSTVAARAATRVAARSVSEA